MSSRNLRKEASVSQLTATSEENIKVCVRIRPPKPGEKKISIEATQNNLRVMTASGPQDWSFDQVGGPTATQQNLFDMCGKSITDSFMEGFNACILAYGQTGGGKTHTLWGPTREDGSLVYEERGLIPRIITYLFAYLESKLLSSTFEFSIKCSYLEVYREKITDLLEENLPQRELREASKGPYFVQDLREVICRNEAAAMDLLTQGSYRRTVAATAANDRSSRSHSVFTITLEQRFPNDAGQFVTRVSKMDLVDLAGSERQKATASEGLLLEQAKAINKSLHMLAQVVNGLAKGEQFINYRNSVLTKLLKESLSGNSKTWIVAAIAAAAEEESISTLRFANSCKKVKKKLSSNEVVEGQDLRIEIARLNNELAALKSELSNKEEAEVHSADEETEKKLKRAERQLRNCKKYEKELKAFSDNTKMRLKLKEDQLRAQAGGLVNEEIEALRDELTLVLSQADKHPRLAELQMEVEELRIQLEIAHSRPSGEPGEEGSGRSDEYMSELMARLKTSQTLLEETKSAHEQQLKDQRQLGERSMEELRKEKEKEKEEVEAARRAVEQSKTDLMLELESFRGKYTQTESRRIELERKLEESNAEMESVQKMVMDSIEQRQSLELNLAQLKGKSVEQSERLAELEKETKRKTVELEQTQLSLDQAQTELSSLRLSSSELEKNYSELKNIAAVTEETLSSQLKRSEEEKNLLESESSSLKLEVEQLRRVKQELEEREEERSAQLKKALPELEELRRVSKEKGEELEKVKQKLSENQSSLEQTLDYVSHSEQDKANLQKENQKLANLSEKLQLQLSSKQMDLASAQKELSEANSNGAKLKAELDLLYDTEEKYEDLQLQFLNTKGLLKDSEAKAQQACEKAERFAEELSRTREAKEEAEKERILLRESLHVAGIAAEEWQKEAEAANEEKAKQEAKWKTTMAEKEEQMRKIKEESLEASKKLKQLIDLVQSGKQESANLSNQVAEQRKEITRLKKELASGEVAQLSRALKEKEEEKEELEEKLASANEQVETLSYASLSAAKKEESLRTELSEAKNQLEQKAQLIQSLEADTKALYETKGNGKLAHFANLKEQCNTLLQEKAELLAQLRRLEDSLGIKADQSFKGSAVIGVNENVENSRPALVKAGGAAKVLPRRQSTRNKI